MNIMHHFMFRTFKPVAFMPLLVITAVGLLGCSRQSDSLQQRSKEKEALLQSLTDSVQQATPNAHTEVWRRMTRSADPIDRLDYCLLYAQHFLMTSTPDSTLYYIEQARQQLDGQPATPRINGMRARMLSTHGSYLFLLHHDADSVIRFYKDALQLLPHSDHTVYMADLSANIADVYADKHDLQRASQWYRRAIVLADSMKLPNHHVLSYRMGLGRIYSSLGDYPAAISNYRLVDQHFRELKPNMQIVFLNNYGNMLYYQKQYAKSLQTFRRLQHFLQQNGAASNVDMLVCELNMADLFLRLGQPDSANVYLSRVEPYFTRHHIDAGTYYANTIRMGIAIRKKQYDKVEYILRNEKIQTPIAPLLQGIRHQTLDEYYTATGNYQQAYNLLKLQHHNNDSLQNNQNNARANDIMMRLREDTLQLHQQLMVQKRNSTYEANMRAMTITIALLVVIISLLLARLFYNRKQALQYHVDMLMLRLANVRQRISPHFIFNVLNACISTTTTEEANHLAQLARLIRTNLEMSSQTYVTLDKEIEFVKQFVELEHHLMGQNFTVDYTLPDHSQLAEIRIPSMFIQILAENAIIHGLRQKEGEKHLHIIINIDQQATQITVKDNGPGFDIRKFNSNKSRIGLNIIRHTMTIINDENSNKNKIRFNIRNNQGCEATIVIPRKIHLL